MARMSEMVDGYVLSLEQQRFVLYQVRDAATRLGATEVLALCDRPLALVRAASALERDFDIERAVQGDGQVAMLLDREIDAIVSAIFGMIESWTRLGQRHPFGVQAGVVLNQAFPKGLAAHVNAPYRDQAVYNEDLIEVLTDPALGEFSSAMNMDKQLSELNDLNDRFRAQVCFEPKISQERLVAAKAACLDETLRLVFKIAVDITDDAIADDLLAGYLGMIKQIGVEMRASRGKRKSAPDAATPTTGEAPPKAAAEAPVVVTPHGGPIDA